MDLETSTGLFSNLNSDVVEMSSINESADGYVAKGKAEISASVKKSQDVSEQYTKGDSSTVDRNARDVKVTQKESSKNSTGKVAVHPPISEMVLDSFKALRKRNGASAEEISNYIGGNFQVNMNRIKPYIKKFLQKGVAEGLLDQVNGSGDDGKFKVKKTGKVKDETGKSKKTKFIKEKEIKKVAARTKKETEKVAARTKKEDGKVAARNKKEAGKVTRKIMNDKVRPKKRVGA